jgi:creatinine amidohydrolase
MYWQDMTWPEIEALDRDATVVVLPVGSVEQHGHHMPTGTDTYLAEAVSAAAAELGCVSVTILPSPCYGLSAHHMHFPGSITLSAATMMAMVSDIVESVVSHGFRRIVVVNGHGGNAGVIDVLASTLGHRFYRRARIASLTYFTLARDAIQASRESSPGGMGHACEFETSLMLKLHPDLVHQERAVVRYPDTGSPYLSTDLVHGGAVRTFLAFDDLSESGTFGDPSLASEEKGERFLALSAQALAAFLKDFASWPFPETKA